MPNYTTNLNLEKPLASEQYNIDVFNTNADKIDQFAGQTPARALTADKLTTGAKINGVNFKGDTDIVTGAGFYYETVTYGAGNLAFIYNQDGKLELYKSLSAGNVGHNPLTSTGYWEKQDLGGSGGRNVGEIIQSPLPLTDAGLHLLDGTRLSGDGIYGEFVDYIAELYTENPTANYFTDETTWQQSITDYGVCGKFVYDSTLNTVRLPKVSDILQGTTDLNALGDLVEAGLPNITGTIDGRSANTEYEVLGEMYPNKTSITGAFEGLWGNQSSTSDSQAGNMLRGFNFDASRSNSIYGNSTTVQPQTIKVLYYIVIANSTKTDIEVDIDEIATDLNGKTDVDLSNCNDTAKILMARMGMPSSTYIDLTLGATNTVYTAPANGWVSIEGTTNATNQNVNIMDTTTMLRSSFIGISASGVGFATILPVRKGATFKVNYSNVRDYTFRFIYAVGSESEAS